MNQYYVTHNTGRNWFYITHCKICVICRTHQMSSEVMTHNIPLLLKMWFQIGGTNRVFKARLAPNKNCGLTWFKHKTLHNNFVGTGHREFLLLASFHISTNFGTHKSLTKSTTKTCSTKRQWKLVRKLCRVICRWFGWKLFFLWTFFNEEIWCVEVSIKRGGRANFETESLFSLLQKNKSIFFIKNSQTSHSVVVRS